VTTAIEYTTDLTDLQANHLQGFFDGWPDPPTYERHLDILRASFRVVIAREPGAPQIVGFVNALSDGVFSAFMPLLEVLPSHRGRGIGSELMRRMLDELGDLYAVDVVCDPELGPFYERFGMQPLLAMARRR
jgi:GNAT superfamily N-acetyltransferase